MAILLSIFVKLSISRAQFLRKGFAKQGQIFNDLGHFFIRKILGRTRNADGM